MYGNLQFVSTINKKYVKGACAFLRSLKKHNPDYNFKYNFLKFEELDQNEITQIKSIYNNIEFLDIIHKDYNYYNTDDKFRTWGYNCFNRFDIFNINADKLIFFDLDMIVNQPLDTILKCDYDFASVQVQEKNRLDHPSKIIFDGGLMVFSKKFLTSQVKHDLIEISKIKKWSSDEPVLNQYFEKNLNLLPKKFNVLSYEYSDYKQDFAILQYVGFNKPWFSNKIEECFDEYIIKNNKRTDLIKMKALFNSYDS